MNKTHLLQLLELPDLLKVIIFSCKHIFNKNKIANPFACIAAGIASLWGPMHGGANEAVLNMLE